MATAPVGHSEVGFSAAHRWLNCPGSVEAQRGLPNISGPAAERGTRLHEVAAAALEGNMFPLEALDEDDYLLVASYVEIITKQMKALGAKLLVEQPFHLDHLHDQLWGTADAVLIWQYAHETWVQIYDLKTGGTPVAVRDADGRLNVQLSGYLLGGIQAATKAGMRPSKYRIAIVQPVRGGLKETIVERKELVQLGADLVQGVEAALAPGAPRVAGEWCQFCRAASGCPALRAAALLEVRNGFPDEDQLELPLVSEAKEVSRETSEADLLRAIEAAPIVELWLKAVRGEAFRRLNDGEPMGDWKLVAKRPRRKWLNEAQALQRLQGAGLELDDAGEFKLKTPAQIEKVIKKQKIEVDLKALVIAKSSGATMAPGDDPREAITPGQAMFDDETED